MAACSSASVHRASGPAAETGIGFGVPDRSTSMPASRYAPVTSSGPEKLPAGFASELVS
jgi:hypothetical protein